MHMLNSLSNNYLLVKTFANGWMCYKEKVWIHFNWKSDYLNILPNSIDT